jgi:hypothetical protein
LICMQIRMLYRVPSNSVRIDRQTHEELKRLAREIGMTIGERSLLLPVVCVSI